MKEDIATVYICGVCGKKYLNYKTCERHEKRCGKPKPVSRWRQALIDRYTKEELEIFDFLLERPEVMNVEKVKTRENDPIWIDVKYRTYGHRSYRYGVLTGHWKKDILRNL